MNRKQMAAVLLVVLCAAQDATAQTVSPPPSAPQSGATPTDRAAPNAVPPKRDTDKDARLCLEFPTNLQIIACAEKYRAHRRGR